MDQSAFSSPHHLKGSLNDTGAAAVAYGTDDGWIVTFREEPLYMEYLSKQVGSPVYRACIMTQMISPGNTKTVWDHPTTGIAYEMAIDPESGEVHTDWEVMEQCENGDPPEPVRFPKAWARFMKKTATAVDGWPIEEWGVVTRSYALSLKAQNVHTVQMLAALTDQNAQNIMGALKYRNLAKAALDERAKTRLYSQEQERAARAEEDAATLRRQVEDLKIIVGQLQAQAQGPIGAAPPRTDDRAPHTHAANAPQLKQLSRKGAKAKQAKAAGLKTSLPAPGAAAPLTHVEEEEAA